MNIVRIAPEHVNGLRRALDTVAREGRYLALTEAPKLIAVVHFVDRLARLGCPQFVALDGKTVVGWCDIRPSDEEDGTGVLGMGLLAKFRRMGLGTRLLDACVDACPFERISLAVLASNVGAIAFYERHGFVHHGRRSAAADLGHRVEDVLLMERQRGS